MSHANIKSAFHVPMRGTESEVAGIISATSSMKTVRDSSTVIPAGRHTEKQMGSEALATFC